MLKHFLPQFVSVLFLLCRQKLKRRLPAQLCNETNDDQSEFFHPNQDMAHVLEELKGLSDISLTLSPLPPSPDRETLESSSSSEESDGDSGEEDDWNASEEGESDSSLGDLADMIIGESTEAGELIGSPEGPSVGSPACDEESISNFEVSTSVNSNADNERTEHTESLAEHTQKVLSTSESISLSDFAAQTNSEKRISEIELCLGQSDILNKKDENCSGSSSAGDAKTEKRDLRIDVKPGVASKLSPKFAAAQRKGKRRVAAPTSRVMTRSRAKAMKFSVSSDGDSATEQETGDDADSSEASCPEYVAESLDAELKHNRRMTKIRKIVATAITDESDKLRGSDAEVFAEERVHIAGAAHRDSNIEDLGHSAVPLSSVEKEGVSENASNKTAAKLDAVVNDNTTNTTTTHPNNHNISIDEDKSTNIASTTTTIIKNNDNGNAITSIFNNDDKTDNIASTVSDTNDIKNRSSITSCDNDSISDNHGKTNNIATTISNNNKDNKNSANTTSYDSDDAIRSITTSITKSNDKDMCITLSNRDNNNSSSPTIIANNNDHTTTTSLISNNDKKFTTRISNDNGQIRNSPSICESGVKNDDLANAIMKEKDNIDEKSSFELRNQFTQSTSVLENDTILVSEVSEEVLLWDTNKCSVDQSICVSVLQKDYGILEQKEERLGDNNNETPEDLENSIKIPKVDEGGIGISDVEDNIGLSEVVKDNRGFSGNVEADMEYSGIGEDDMGIADVVDDIEFPENVKDAVGIPEDLEDDLQISDVEESPDSASAENISKNERKRNIPEEVRLPIQKEGIQSAAMSHETLPNTTIGSFSLKSEEERSIERRSTSVATLPATAKVTHLEDSISTWKEGILTYSSSVPSSETLKDKISVVESRTDNFNHDLTATQAKVTLMSTRRSSDPMRKVGISKTTVKKRMMGSTLNNEFGRSIKEKRTELSRTRNSQEENITDFPSVTTREAKEISNEDRMCDDSDSDFSNVGATIKVIEKTSVPLLGVFGTENELQESKSLHAPYEVDSQEQANIHSEVIDDLSINILMDNLGVALGDQFRTLSPLPPSPRPSVEEMCRVSPVEDLIGDFPPLSPLPPSPCSLEEKSSPKPSTSVADFCKPTQKYVSNATNISTSTQHQQLTSSYTELVTKSIRRISRINQAENITKTCNPDLSQKNKTIKSKTGMTKPVYLKERKSLKRLIQRTTSESSGNDVNSGSQSKRIRTVNQTQETSSVVQGLEAQTSMTTGTNKEGILDIDTNEGPMLANTFEQLSKSLTENKHSVPNKANAKNITNTAEPKDSKYRPLSTRPKYQSEYKYVEKCLVRLRNDNVRISVVVERLTSAKCLSSCTIFTSAVVQFLKKREDDLMPEILNQLEAIQPDGDSVEWNPVESGFEARLLELLTQLRDSETIFGNVFSQMVTLCSRSLITTCCHSRGDNLKGTLSLW